MDDPDVTAALKSHPFEDTIDGYFPLHESLVQMLERMGFASAIVTLDYAPIMHIDCLPGDAPVPLNIRAGFAGLIGKMTFCVTPDTLCGVGTWRWLTADAHNVARFDAATRLGEPCFATGRGFIPGSRRIPLLGAVAGSKEGGITVLNDPTRIRPEATSIWGPFQASEFIYADGFDASHGRFMSKHRFSADRTFFVQ